MCGSAPKSLQHRDFHSWHPGCYPKCGSLKSSHSGNAPADRREELDLIRFSSLRLAILGLVVLALLPTAPMSSEAAEALAESPRGVLATGPVITGVSPATG